MLSLFSVVAFNTRLNQAPEGLIGAVYLGVVASALAYWLWDNGVAAIGPTATSQYSCLMPLFAAILGWSILGESLSFEQGIGVGMVSFGQSQRVLYWRRGNVGTFPDLVADRAGPR